MVSEDGHRSVARVAIENCKFERVHEIGVALGVISQLAQFAFRHRDKFVEKFVRSTTRREPRTVKKLATRRSAKNTYLGEAAAAGAAIAGEAAAPGAIGGSLPDMACGDDLFAALAAAFACRLQR